MPHRNKPSHSEGPIGLGVGIKKKHPAVGYAAKSLSGEG